MAASFTVETKGIEETLDALRGLSKDLRKEANAEIRLAAREAAEGLADALRRSASSSATPVARRVAQSIKVKSDRFPTVTIGGNMKVGVRGGKAAALVWGSERGGDHFGVPQGSGYWIAPAVRAFEGAQAVPIFKRALYEIVRRYGLDV